MALAKQERAMEGRAISEPPHIEHVSPSPGRRLAHWASIAVLPVGTAALILFALWKLFGPVFPESKLRAVDGATEADVRRILGQPSEITAQGQWIYDWWPNQGWVSITFDEGGRVCVVNDEQVGVFR
jgi:hypothetical protein